MIDKSEEFAIQHSFGVPRPSRAGIVAGFVHVASAESSRYAVNSDLSHTIWSPTCLVQRATRLASPGRTRERACGTSIPGCVHEAYRQASNRDEVEMEVTGQTGSHPVNSNCVACHA